MKINKIKLLKLKFKIYSSLILLFFIGAVFLYTNLTSYKKIISNSKTIVIFLSQSVNTIDPIFISSLEEKRLVSDLFEGLMTLDQFGNPVGGLANYWKMSADKRIYKFILKKSNWSDGSSVSVNDVVETFKRLLDKKNNSTHVSLLFNIKGAKDYFYHGGDFSKVGIKVVSNKEIDIILNTSSDNFLYTLSDPSFAIINKTNLEHGYKISNNIVTNGSYIIDKYRKNNFVSLLKNDHYYDSKNVAIPKVVYYFNSKLDDAIIDFKNNKKDIVYDVADNPKLGLSKFISSNSRVYNKPSVAYILINSKNDKLVNKHLREALSLSIDRNYIVSETLKGAAKPAYHYIPSGLNDYKSQEYIWDTMTAEETQARVNRLLLQSGYLNNKFTIVLDVPNIPELISSANAIRTQWNKYGIIADIKIKELNEQYNHLARCDYMLSFILSPVEVNNTPGLFLQQFNSKYKYNYSGYINHKYDIIFNKSLLASTTEERNGLNVELEKLLLDDFVVIPIFFPSSRTLVSTRVQGYVDNNLDIHPVRYMFLNN